jgi:hypothetical protein
MIDIKVEPWSILTALDRGLCVRHWQEIAHHQDKIPLSPDWERYRKMAEAGVIHLTTARDAGILVGYLVYFVVPHLHYSKSITALSDVLYLAPEYRLGTTGIRLLKVAEVSLRALGVQRVIQNVKVDHDWSPILLRQGYTLFERVYSKLLE